MSFPVSQLNRDEQQIALQDQGKTLHLNGGNVTVKKTQSFPFGKCRICHDIATGVHYGVITCEGCKGFFKRVITQGVAHRCYFGNRCVVTIGTRNRCKSCRFNRCVEQGMSMDRVKMGRIPKKIKEKALLDQKKSRCYRLSPQINDGSVRKKIVSCDDDCSSSSQTTQSTSSSSSTSNYTFHTQLSSGSSSDATSTSSEDEVCSNDHSIIFDSMHRAPLSNNLDYSLSSLCLPEFFYSLSVSKPERTSVQFNHISLTNLSFDNKPMTVLQYISKISENTLAECHLNYNLHTSKNVLHTMKHLLPKLSQPFLVFELDFEVMSFFRYLRWKMFKSYLKHTKRIRMLVQRMLEIVNLNKMNQSMTNPTYEQMWNGVQAGIPIHVNELIGFAQDSPGLNELSPSDFIHMLNNRVFDFWIALNYPLFYKNESYIVTPNGLQYTRYFMNMFIGKTTTDALHECSKRLHSLNITHIEHSLVMTIVLSQQDSQVEEQENLYIIKHCYMYALYIQLCSTRAENEAKLLFENILKIIETISYTSELCRKNIGKLVLDQAARSD